MDRVLGVAGEKRATLDRVRREHGWNGNTRIRRWAKQMQDEILEDPERFGFPANLSQEGSELPDGRYGPIKRVISERFNLPSWMNLEQLTVGGQNVTIFDLCILPPELLDKRLGDSSFLSSLLFGRKDASPWRVQVLNREVFVPDEVTERCLELLGVWQGVFPKEETFVQEHFGVPSLLVRFDCVYHKATGLGVYEIEERPAGVGITLVVNGQFKKLFGQLRSEWPEFSIAVSHLRWSHGGDDHLWAREVPLKKSTELVWVRAEPWEQGLQELVPRSVSTVLEEGSKSYGVQLGLWNEVRYEDAESGAVQLPWEKGFCIKPFQGSKTQNIFIWDPRVQPYHHRERAIAHLKSLGRAYLQAFVPPMSMDIGGVQYNTIYRIFFGWSPRLEKWIPLGGEWDARPAPHSLIHGALDAVTGPSPLA